MADLGIREGRIKAIGRLGGAAHLTVDAHGRVVCPGFIDIHSHSDLVTLVNPRSESKIMQGVTTEVIGNCGLTPAPASSRTFPYLKYHFAHPPLQWEWRNFTDFLDAHERTPASVNLVPLIGHGTLRIAVMGFENRRPRNDEMEEMKRLLREALDAGVFGLSTGLIYTPACYAETEEVVELARLLSPKGRLYTTHIRGEGANLVNAVEEALRIGREAGTKIQLSHHKCCGIKSWGKVHETLGLIEAAREEGIDVTCDVYPYDASSTDLAICLPPWVREESPEKMLERMNDPALRSRIRKEMESDEMQGFWSSPAATTGWGRIRIAAVTKQEYRGIEGMSLQEIAEARRADVFDICFDLLIKEGGKVSCIYFEMREEDVRTVLSNPISMIGSDGSALSPHGTLGRGKPHPRNYGTFPRVLGKYARDERLFPLEEAVRKMTSFPAQKLGLRDRGLLREGFWADMVIFDPARVKDTATFEQPARFPEGIDYVFVNGEMVVCENRHTGALPGKLLRAT